MKRLSVAVFAAALAMPAAVQAQAPAEAAAPAPEIVPQPASKLPLKHAPQPTTAPITAADLMTRLYIYADDSMMGREAGTPGNFKATTYIAGQVEKMGLKPAGDGGTYFQTIPLKTRAVDSSSSLTAGGAALTYGADWAVRGSAPMTLSSVPAVFGGALGDSQTVSPADMKGKLVVFALGQNRRTGRQPEGSDSAAALAIIVPDRYMQFFGRPSTFVDDPDQPQRGGGTTLFLSAAGAAKLFGKPVDSLAPGAAGPMVSGDIRISTTPVADPARNVVAILPGSDPSLKGEYVAIGAHNDHIGMTDRPVDHDSLRIFNHIVRPGGAEQSGKQATRRSRLRSTPSSPPGARPIPAPSARTRSPTAPTTMAPARSACSKSPSISRRSRATPSPSGRFYSCGTSAKRKDCSARRISPITPRCPAIPSWRSSTWI